MSVHKVINNVMLVELIGKGAYSEVYRGKMKQNTGEIDVAVKVIPRTVKNTGNIDAEIKILQSIKHPNIVRFICQYNTKNNTYLITELCSRGTFKNFVAEKYPNSPIPAEHAKLYFYQVCLGVQELHRQGIVHRDLKPDNIFINDAYMIKIGDFGFAKMLGDNDALQSFKGTPINMAPEIFKTDIKLTDSYNNKCDIWSLGTILFEMVYGRIIAGNVQTMKELTALLLSDKDIEIQDQEGVSAECQDLISKMLRKNPDKRLSIGEILMHPWLRSAAENPPLIYSLIKGFFKPLEAGIQEISQETFDKGKLRKWICLVFKTDLRKKIGEIAAKIAQIAEITSEATSHFSEFEMEYPPLPDLTNLLWKKYSYLVEKFFRLKIVCEQPSTNTSKSIAEMIAEASAKYDMQKTVDKYRNSGVEIINSNSLGSDLLQKLYCNFFEVAEATFKNEFRNEPEALGAHIRKEQPLHLQLYKVIQIIGFDFVGIKYEIQFKKDLKEVNFDPHSIDSYLDEYEHVDEDDFNQAEIANFKAACAVIVSPEYAEGPHDADLAKAVEVFTKAFKNKLLSDSPELKLQ